jgi:hypothetical protein
MIKYIYVSALFLIIFQSCYHKTPIPISNTLEIALDYRYNEYCDLLNQAWKNDTVAICKFFKINWIHDAAGYSHALILLKLVNKSNDDEIAFIFKSMSEYELTNLTQYIEVGLDQESRDVKKELLRNYPLTFNMLRDKSNMKYLFE